MIDAVDKYDHSKEVSLKTYAQYRIKGAILDELRSMDWYSRSMRKKIQDLEAAIQTVEVREGRPAQEQEIADELGSSREVISRILEDFSRQGIIELSRGTIKVIEQAALEEGQLM